MGRSLQIRQPAATEIRKLEDFLTQDLHPQQQRRANIILLYAEGLTGVDIAFALGVHPLTVYQDLRVWDEAGLDCLEPPSKGGAVKRISPAQEKKIVRDAERSPVDLGLPFARWSLQKLRDYLIKQGIITQLSREHLRRVLKKGAFASCA